MEKRKKILVCPLNWGLGHATRCIPIIRELHNQGLAVSLASDGRALSLLKEEFPGLECFELPAYKVTYRTSNMYLNLAPQMPRIFNAIRKERKLIQRIIEKENFDFLISDNRFGCVSDKIPTVFISHQINIKIPFRPFEKIVNAVNYRYIRQFSECWIPDNSGTPNLAGSLSHDTKDLNVKYLGAISRMQVLQLEKKYDLTAVLSGPEPQRSILEKKFVEQAKQTDLKVLLVQGKPESRQQKKISKNIDSVSFLTSEDLNRVFAQSKLLLSRSGYTTVLDLAKTGCRAVLIPTPGQTEQEYLSENLTEQGIFYSQTQKDFNLKKIMQAQAAYKGFNSETYKEDSVRIVISQFLAKYSEEKTSLLNATK